MRRFAKSIQQLKATLARHDACCYDRSLRRTMGPLTLTNLSQASTVSPVLGWSRPSGGGYGVTACCASERGSTFAWKGRSEFRGCVRRVRFSDSVGFFGGIADCAGRRRAPSQGKGGGLDTVQRPFSTPRFGATTSRFAATGIRTRSCTGGSDVA